MTKWKSLTAALWKWQWTCTQGSLSMCRNFMQGMKLSERWGYHVTCHSFALSNCPSLHKEAATLGLPHDCLHLQSASRLQPGAQFQLSSPQISKEATACGVHSSNCPHLWWARRPQYGSHNQCDSDHPSLQSVWNPPHCHHQHASTWCTCASPGFFLLSLEAHSSI